VAAQLRDQLIGTVIRRGKRREQPGFELIAPGVEVPQHLVDAVVPFGFSHLVRIRRRRRRTRRLQDHHPRCGRGRDPHEARRKRLEEREKRTRLEVPGFVAEPQLDAVGRGIVDQVIDQHGGHLRRHDVVGDARDPGTDRRERDRGAAEQREQLHDAMCRLTHDQVHRKPGVAEVKRDGMQHILGR
jgi:hypothetical protein